ncbi:hypothetical protein J437_LFUL014965 [Ladona fulva]|uniref:RecQ-mediated genome instability protein 2 n=1 Tax=Ladona fulva TaxID=123851 RepID=A0A8K0KR25_LADFU|nr:hypothetical protein J437_LFUL014965 [Ladona fulva]
MCDQTPCKLMVEEITKCIRNESKDCWNLRVNIGDKVSKNLKIHMVWIQGKVDAVIDNADKVAVLLNDGTGSVLVTNVGISVSPEQLITKGNYCSAIGYIQKVTDIPEVHAVKVSNLSRNTVFEKMWPYEVKELRLFLLGLVAPHLKSIEDESM